MPLRSANGDCTSGVTVRLPVISTCITSSPVVGAVSVKSSTRAVGRHAGGILNVGTPRQPLDRTGAVGRLPEEILCALPLRGEDQPPTVRGPHWDSRPHSG